MAVLCEYAPTGVASKGQNVQGCRRISVCKSSPQPTCVHSTPPPQQKSFTSCYPTDLMFPWNAEKDSVVSPLEWMSWQRRSEKRAEKLWGGGGGGVLNKWANPNVDSNDWPGGEAVLGFLDARELATRLITTRREPLPLWLNASI